MKKQDDGSVIIENTLATQQLIQQIAVCNALQITPYKNNQLLISTHDTADRHNTMRLIHLSLTP